MGNLYLIAGLGNPGREYVRTRHNAGFMVLDRLAARVQAGWALEKKFDSKVARAERDGNKLFLCEPETFMNASGEAVAAVAAYYQVAVERSLVVVDDADLPLGEIRLRPSGSSGGHHGLESIERHLGTREFQRLRVGIGRDSHGARQITGYVLSPFSAAEAERVEQVLERACDQIECWWRDGIAKAMNRFNGVVKA